jgi:hypothetical protein
MPIDKINGTTFANITKFSGVANASIAKLNGSDAPSSSASVVTDSLFLDWRPGSVSGTQVTDQSGNGNHGTMYNGATVTTTPSGETAFYTDGVNDYIYRQISHSDLSGVDYPLTYETWLYVKGSLSGTAISQVIHNDPADTVDWHRFFLDKRSGQNRIVTQKYTSVGQLYVWYVNTGVTLNDETWHHVVTTFELDGSNRNVVTQYVNGQLAGSATSTYSTSYRHVPWSESSGNTNFSIGAVIRSRNSYYHGYVGDVRFYTDKLTTSEISNNFDATKSDYGY